MKKLLVRSSRTKSLIFALIGVVCLVALLALPLQQMRSNAQSEKSGKTAKQNVTERFPYGEPAPSGEVSTLTLPTKKERRELRKAATPLAPAVGTDLGSEIEPNNTFATATTLTGSDVKIRGDVYPNADEDWYKFTAAAGNRVYAAVMTSYSSSGSTDSQLRIFGSDGTTQLEFDEDDGSLGGLSSSIAGAVMPAGTGTYYIQVKHPLATSQLRPYELYLKVQSGSPTPEVEGNDTQATANPLPPSGWVSGARNPAVATEQDWYSFTANAGDTVYLGLDLDPERDNVQWNGRLGLALFGDATNQILVVDDASVGSAANPLSEAMFMTVKTAGTYYAFVDSATAATGGPTATYNLSVSVIPKTNVGINCTTYTSTNVPLPIADGALTSSTITVPATTARIASTKVSINATHTLMADMDVNLRSPAGNDNGLFNDIGATATGGQTMMDLTLDQYSSGVPFVFTVLRPLILKPEFSYRLDWYDGENPSGVWTLDIRDDLVNATTGTLNSWSLEICEQPAVAGSVIYTQDFEANNGSYTHSGTADEWQYGTPATAATTTGIAAFIGCNSGTMCWKTDLTGTYEILSNQDLVSPSIVLPATTGTLDLQWAMRYQMESSTFDHASVSVTEVGNPTNTRIVWQWTGATMTTGVGTPAVNIGNSAGWGNYRANISDFANKTVQLTFHVDTDSTINFAGVAIDDVSVRNTPPTAAGVSVSGRVLTADGRGVRNARVTILDRRGIARNVATGPFGYYRFDNVDTGQSYVVSVVSRRFNFESQVIQVNDNLADLDFIAGQ
ncbi:MAG: pre-peptidase C-terminal domain-containing protein [Pyrinomonadaceae bacterium]